MSLDDYQAEGGAFSQETALQKSNVKDSKGICAGLVIEWIKLCKSGSKSAEDRMNTLREKLKVSAQNQQNLVTLWDRTAKKNAYKKASEAKPEQTSKGRILTLTKEGPSRSQVAELFTRIAEDNDLKVEWFKDFEKYNPIITHFLVNENLVAHCLDLNFGDRNHLIGMIPDGNKILIFDPNHGEFFVNKDKISLVKFGEELTDALFLDFFGEVKCWSLFKVK